MAAKHLNLKFTDVQHAALKSCAAAEGVSMREFCGRYILGALRARGALLDREPVTTYISFEDLQNILEALSEEVE